MSTTITGRRARIKELAVAAFEVDADELTERTRFVDDLGVDSLSAIDLLAALEKEFDVEIDQEDVVRLVTLDAVYEVVAEAAGWDRD
ncbi:acyl carrier protein [Actinosynnema sp. NPDC020468]|uniref:acyl carrier protein n=1 Tax=Actinosynnema sp. NPDC020468 TaxID=3154488 RepID=UPI003400F0EA